MLGKPQTIYGRFAYLATLMVASELDVKATAEGPTSIGKLPRRFVQKPPPHSRGSRLLDSHPLSQLFDSAMTPQSSIGLYDAQEPEFQ